MKKKTWLYIGIVAFGLLLYPIANNYLHQEYYLFMHSKLDTDHEFSFPYPHKEKFISTPDEAKIHLVHMTTPNPKGVVVYYHGQGENIETKGKIVSKLFNTRGYDIIMMDYRGCGKSTGKMNQAILFEDALIPYQYAKEHYTEENIVVYGCSLGTGIAANVASKTNPKMLILESPYYNMIDLGKYARSYLPTPVIKLILKYPLRTDLYLQEVTAPIHILHGTNDTIIPYNSSSRLIELIKDQGNADLTTIEGAEHNNITKTFPYHQKLDQWLD